MIILSQSLEIEFKNLLFKKEYEQIKTHFQLDDSLFFLQVNHYFDTPSFTLKEKGSALRIRKKGNDYELTLKQPVKDGLLETNQLLTEEQATLAMETNQIPNGSVTDLMMAMNIEINQICFFGTLTTKRVEWEYENGLLVLDHSSYLNIDDYELEYEVSNRKQGQAHFIKLLTNLNIPLRQTENKIKRFYLRKYQQSK
jgi:uncharacterized protein YjbK